MGWFSWKPKIVGEKTSNILRYELTEYAPTLDDIYFSDRIYQIPADPVDVMHHVHSSGYKYKKASRDCDDFVRIFRGILSQKGIGNLLAMDCIIEYLKKGERKRHAVIAFWHNGELVFGEPQREKMLNLVKYPNYKVVRLIL